MGKSTISMAIFNSHVSSPEGIYIYNRFRPIPKWFMFLRKFSFLKSHPWCHQEPTRAWTRLGSSAPVIAGFFFIFSDWAIKNMIKWSYFVTTIVISLGMCIIYCIYIYTYIYICTSFDCYYIICHVHSGRHLPCACCATFLNQWNTN